METTYNLEPSLAILIVEDDGDCRKLLSTIIHKKFPGLTVYTAINGREGVELFSEYTPTIVITDFNMPEMGGVQLIQRIRAIKPETKIIVFTADTEKAALEESVGEGLEVDHYAFKPVDIQKLFIALEQCISEITTRQ